MSGGGGCNNDTCMLVLKIIITILFAIDILFYVSTVISVAVGSSIGSVTPAWVVPVMIFFVLAILIDVAILYCLWKDMKEGLMICCVVLTIWLIVAIICACCGAGWILFGWGCGFIEYILLIIYTVLLYKGK